MKNKPKKKAGARAASPARRVPGTPYGDRVLVKPSPAEETTSFGIIIPSDAKEKPERGRVVAVGPGKKADDGRAVPLSVKVGDEIMFDKSYADKEVVIDGQEYYLIREDSITFIF